MIVGSATVQMGPMAWALLVDVVDPWQGFSEDVIGLS